MPATEPDIALPKLTIISSRKNKTGTNIAQNGKIATPNVRRRQIACDLMRNDQQAAIAFAVQIELKSPRSVDCFRE
jgi:hypothetical protein